MTKAKSATVQVTLQSEHPLRFDITSNDLPKDANGDLVFTNDHHPGFNVDFQFSDATLANYLFPPNAQKAEAVWSLLGASNCPTETASEVFQPLKVSSDCKTLTVHNSNEGPNVGHFGYTLRVTKDGGTTFLALDPGGLNQNGATSYSMSTAVAFAFGAAVGVLLTLGTQALLTT